MGFKLYRLWSGIVFVICYFYVISIALWLIIKLQEILFSTLFSANVGTWLYSFCLTSKEFLSMLLFNVPLNTLFIVVLFVSAIAYLIVAIPPYIYFVNKLNERYALNKIPLNYLNILSNYKIEFRDESTVGFGICDIMNYDLDSDFCKKYLAYKEAQLAKVAQKHNQKVTKAELYWQKVYEEEAKNAKKEAENERIKQNNIVRYFAEQNENNT
ncbi:hypothetical protein [uncultured Helicobacter sp.]|uniref:hypothetical protein n=1 Tax=uncultured Helicobacter sp. TaxID=175537 RepID=UPI00374F9289